MPRWPILETGRIRLHDICDACSNINGSPFDDKNRSAVPWHVFEHVEHVAFQTKMDIRSVLKGTYLAFLCVEAATFSCCSLSMTVAGCNSVITLIVHCSNHGGRHSPTSVVAVGD